MLRGLALALAAATLGACTGATPQARRGGADDERTRVHRLPSVAVGEPFAGRLVRGVQLPAEGAGFFTWDPVKRRSPNRGWRRFGTDRLVRTVLRVVDEYGAAHPGAPRVGIGDLSRPNGGDFGPQFGGIGHASHQNGLDVDVYYPRRDGLERAPVRPAQIDRRLAQDLVDRFVAAGAVKVFVGPNTGLRGPRGVVAVLPYHHDNHLHARFGAVARTAFLLGRSERGRPIRGWQLGDGGRTVLVVGCIHGTECEGIAIADRLIRGRPPAGAALLVVRNLNPDGLALGVRQNGRGVDLNRNFASEWRPRGRRWDPEYAGPRPFSERETRIARDLILRVRPSVTVWFHQPQGLVRAWGGSIATARRYARLAGARYRSLRWPAGTAPNWQNRRLRQVSFVVELPSGPLSPVAARRHAAAILRLAE